MPLQRRSVRMRVALLVLVPLAFLVALSGYTAATSANSVLSLTRSKVMMDRLAQPVADLQQALRSERAQALVYYAGGRPAQLARLERCQARTDHALAAFRTVADSASVRDSASPAGRKAIAGLLAGAARLPGLRAAIPSRTVSASTLFTTYNATLAASYQVLEQAILAEGDSSQVLPGIALIELAVSGEYLQQENALLNADFAAHAFPVKDQKTFASLVGAHRMLYAQSMPYLTAADRATLQHDLRPGTAKALAAMEDRIAAPGPAYRPPPVRQSVWNAVTGTYSSQLQQAVRQAETRLADGARAQADAKLRRLYLAGGAALAAVILSLVFSLWVAAGLTRQLSALRDSALELAQVALPGMVRRLRAGEEVDVDSEIPPLPPERHEIGQVHAAFNAARRTAVEAAVDEAKLRRGISDVFRNLAKRHQSLLHRQMALLDALERRENDPGNLESLFRIDHLTTRMRRHAESLVVLAGDTPRRGWRNPVPFVDVLRAAAAEVEDYTRIKVITAARASLAGPAVADVIHLIAELAENATVYSPRDNQVKITGELVAHGFAIDIEDRGLGLSDEELAILNERLADPPPFDLSGSDQLGIFVAGQLAKRHGIHASLTRSPYGGVTAVVLIPMSLVVTGSEDAQDGETRPLPARSRAGLNGRAVTATALEVTAGGHAPAHPATLIPTDADLPAGTGAAGGSLADPHLLPGRPPWDDATPPASRPPWDDATPPATQPPRGDTGTPSGQSPREDAGLTAVQPSGDSASPPGGRAPAAHTRREHAPAPAVQPEWHHRASPAGEDGHPAPDAPRAGARPGFTENGLPQRVRRASLAPQLRAAPASPRATGSGDHGRGRESAARDPEMAATALSAFHRGWRQGLAMPATAPEQEPASGQEGGQEA